MNLNRFQFEKFQENQKVLDDSYGGVLGLEQLLRTDFKNGLNGKAEDINARKENYGKNEVVMMVTFTE